MLGGRGGSTLKNGLEIIFLRNDSIKPQTPSDSSFVFLEIRHASLFGILDFWFSVRPISIGGAAGPGNIGGWGFSVSGWKIMKIVSISNSIRRVTLFSFLDCVLRLGLGWGGMIDLMDSSLKLY